METTLDGVLVNKLNKIPDERGAIYHMLRCDDKIYRKFGEIYFSIAYPGVIKGWHEHTKQTQNYSVVSGMIKLVLFDNRKDSPSYKNLLELFIGEENYCLVTIPPGIINGYKCIGNKKMYTANCSDIPHEPDEMIRHDPFDNFFNYDWDIKIQ